LHHNCKINRGCAVTGGAYGVARGVLFRMDAETAHERTLRALRLATPVLRVRRAPAASTTVFGVTFPNPVGLAAGMDKNGVALRAWPALGFGFVEVGTVTLHAQPGNPRPRMFRLPASRAVINRMGFNNAGAGALARRLGRLGKLPYPLGISLGKSKVTPLADAIDDYVGSLRVLGPYGDYFAVNVSSPNTPGLRSLQDRSFLGDLLQALRAQTDRPLLVKVAPDLTDTALAEVLEVAGEHRADGIIATNTTVSRAGVVASEAPQARSQDGGLSGPPVHERVVQIVKFITSESAMPVVGVGGVDSPAAARRLVDAGASLVQLYTGLVYQGPALVRACVTELRGER
jgi:dihydroorotate dehydrogenase